MKGFRASLLRFDSVEREFSGDDPNVVDIVFLAANFLDATFLGVARTGNHRAGQPSGQDELQSISMHGRLGQVEKVDLVGLGPLRLFRRTVP